MPFPVEPKYIEEMESLLKVEFPTIYRNRMIRENGGEISNEEYHFELYPFFDKKDRKRISRTCNHIFKETKSAQEWKNFPEDAIAIGSDGYGNQLVLLIAENRTVSDELYFWDHETGETVNIANNIVDFEK